MEKQKKIYKKWYFWLGIPFLLFFVIPFVMAIFAMPSYLEEQARVESLHYAIHEVSNYDIGDVTIRRGIHVIIEETLTNEEKELLAKKIISEYLDEQPVNALSLGFYSSADQIGKGYPLGSVEYVPYGEWSKASEVKTGDYSNFEYVCNFK